MLSRTSIERMGSVGSSGARPRPPFSWQSVQASAFEVGPRPHSPRIEGATTQCCAKPFLALQELLELGGVQDGRGLLIRPLRFDSDRERAAGQRARVGRLVAGQRNHC